MFISLSKLVFVKSPQVPKPALFINKSTSFTCSYNFLQFFSTDKSILIICEFVSISFFTSCNFSSSLATSTKS